MTSYLNISRISLLLFAYLLFTSCLGGGGNPLPASGNSYASLFSIDGDQLTVISPYDNAIETVNIAAPMDNIICMSSSYVACLDAVGADSVITAVSGLRYLSNPRLTQRQVYDIGYEAAPDYERIVSLQPDLLVTYAIGSSVPDYVMKLREAGVKVLVLYDQVENHPLSRAEYVRLFGALTGKLQEADSVFKGISDRYETLRDEVRDSDMHLKTVLMNIPYADLWYVPGNENYMSMLIRDAGGEILGARKHRRESSVISMEEAYGLARKADYWLHPGRCKNLSDLRKIHPLFNNLTFNDMRVFNNDRRANVTGGNDFWESGALRADLLLEDLVRILHPEISQTGDTLHYYVELK